MNDDTPHTARRYSREIESDARRERQLIPQALIAIFVVVALVVVRELLVR